MTDDAGDAPNTPPFEEDAKRHVVLPVPRWVRVLRLIAFALGCFPTMFILLSTLFAQHSLLCELVSHFYIQYFIALLISVVTLFLLKQRRTALFFLPALIWSGVQLSPYFIQPPNHAFIQKDSETISLVAFNVNAQNTHYDEVANYLLSTDADVISLEEVTNEWMQRIAPLLKTKYPYAISQPQEDNFGVALFSKYPFVKSQIIKNSVSPSSTTTLPTPVALIDIRGIPLVVLGIHPPPPISDLALTLRTKWLSDYGRVAQEWSADHHSNFVIMGDFNCSPWSPYFPRFLEESWTHDVALGNGLQTTWPYDKWLLHTPIDHICASANFATVTSNTGPSCGSDHHAVYAKLALIN